MKTRYQNILNAEDKKLLLKKITGELNKIEDI